MLVNGYESQMQVETLEPEVPEPAETPTSSGLKPSDEPTASVMDAIQNSEEEAVPTEARETIDTVVEPNRDSEDTEVTPWRTWTTADAHYTVEAKFVKYAFGTLTLEKKDGTTVDVELDKLCQEDQDFVRQRKQ